jgi:hypothetical protein
MLKELILANPIISLILVVVPTAGVVWKVLHALYVKPRDFRINTMEKDIYVLRNEILKIEKRQHTPSDNIGIVKTSESEISPTKDTEEAKSANISDLSGELVLNDLQDLLDIWNDEELSDLQKKHIEETYENKSVVWEVVLKSVGEVNDGKIYVSVVSPRAEFQLDNAVAYFDESYKEALLMVKKGESVILSGTIERFFLSPMLKDCKIVRK